MSLFLMQNKSKDLREAIRETDVNNPNWMDDQLIYAIMIEMQKIIYDNRGLRGS